jgi:hypothetical protein
MTPGGLRRAKQRMESAKPLARQRLDFVQSKKKTLAGLIPRGSSFSPFSLKD